MTGDGFNSGRWNQFTCASTQTGLGGTSLLQGCTTAAELLQFAGLLQSTTGLGVYLEWWHLVNFITLCSRAFLSETATLATSTLWLTAFGEVKRDFSALFHDCTSCHSWGSLTNFCLLQGQMVLLKQWEMPVMQNQSLNIHVNSKTVGQLMEEKSIENYWYKECTPDSRNPRAANCRKPEKNIAFAIFPLLYDWLG